MFMYGRFRFLFYLSEEVEVYSSHLLNSNQNILEYPVNCCSSYTNIVSKTIHAGIPCIFWFIHYNKNFFTKCYMVGCSIQNICAITTHIESSICKLAEQKLIYVT